MPNTQDDSEKKSKMRRDLDSLKKEMEVAQYMGKTATGQLRRKVSRKESLHRSKKRKLLEEEDREELAIIGDKDEGRLRGSRAAIEDHVIQGSLIFQTAASGKPGPTEKFGAGQYRYEDEGEDQNFDDEASDVESDDDYEGDSDVYSENDDDDNEKEENKLDAETGEPAEVEDEHDDSRNRQFGSSKEPRRAKRPSRRRMYKLRNFKSFRMAQRHGDALAAHARGQPRLAIQKLKQVARDAPSAPQIYSSLGMVYEDMRNRAKEATLQPSTKDDSTREQDLADPAEDCDPDNRFPDQLLAEQCDLGKKAYGAYHAAAILCKKDFALWVRAADAACDIANLHAKTGAAPNLSMNTRLYHRNERKRWLLEAQRDFTTADRLEPPGIDIPAKLAAVHMDLGNLSEALTILTDLKNRKSNKIGKRPEFHTSYKAWVLYSDLMLRIGHECIEWNRGVDTNDNYMFRRWLRKLSRKFDWQERRLQGLCLALEAAAGSKSTGALFGWMRERLIASKTTAVERHAERERWHLASADNALGDSKTQDPHHNPSLAKETIGKVQGAPKTEQRNQESVGQGVEENNNPMSALHSAEFEQERKIIIERNKAELDDFDKTTADMGLPANSLASKDRETMRHALMESHERAMRSLTGEYANAKAPEVQPLGEHAYDHEDKIIGMDEAPLPLSASCKQVCAIASELMKHLHGLKLYAGVRIVGESISLYFKERSAIRDRRIEKRKKLEDWGERIAANPLLFEPYDNKADSGDSEDEASTFLSDESDMEDDDNTELLETIRRGALPPELRVLYGLALIGEGGRNFVAAKCVDAIDTIEQETSTWLSDGEGETLASGNPLWQLFRRAMTEPLGRTAAYAFLADVLRKTKKEQEWAPYFSLWLRRHLETLRSVGLLDALLRLQGNLSPYTNFRKNQVLKIILASIRFDVWTADCPMRRNPVNRQPMDINDSTCVENVAVAVSSLASIIHLVWKVEKNGSISDMCAEVVRVTSKCLKWLSKIAAEKLPYSSLKKIVEDSKLVLAFFCHNSAPNLKKLDSGTKLADVKWGNFPVQTSWQTDPHRPLSLSIYNLSIACNVSLFSGWEPEEFTLRLLRRRHGHRHFGIHIHDKRVTGFLPSSIEAEISRQWSDLSDLLPEFPSLNFTEKVAAVKNKEWYSDELENRKRANASTPIAGYAEEDGVALLLAFSSLCLRLAESEHEAEVRDQLLQNSLSIILPVSQFCIDDTLWTSDIGGAAASLIDFEEWRLMPGRGPDAFMGKDTYKKPSKWKKRVERRIEKKVQEWLKGTGKPALHSFVTIPTDVMKSTWKQTLLTPGTEETNKAAQVSMEAVDEATSQLRGCYTEAAFEKVSLQVSVALLELASQPACHDPFTCLQHAATFASQASKAGTSDMVFRKPIPEVEKCKPLEALSILGRADCLHAIYFPNEAAFLCSFVARACRLHRDRERPEYEWNDLWRIVAIYGYNVSVMIRTTVSTVLDKQKQKSFHAMWARDVVEELERGRSDGLAWKRSLSLNESNEQSEQGNSDSEVEQTGMVNQNALGTDEADSESEDHDDEAEKSEPLSENDQGATNVDDAFLIEAQNQGGEPTDWSYNYPYGDPFSAVLEMPAPGSNPPDFSNQRSDDESLDGINKVAV